jgi:hypothetical protein
MPYSKGWLGYPHKKIERDNSMLEPESEETKDLAIKLYNKKWYKYRIGDVYFKPPGSGNVSYHLDQFPDSIAAMYLQQTGGEPKRIDVMKTIVKPYDKRYDLVIHIRIGDVMCSIQSKCYSAYENPGWWETLIEYTQQKNIKNVYVITGAHKHRCLFKSARYIINRIKFLKEKGLNVTYEPGKSPDEDLRISSNAQYFVSTGGYYGALVSELVKVNGGAVISTTTGCSNPKKIMDTIVMDKKLSSVIILLGLMTGSAQLFFHEMGYIHLLDHQLVQVLPYCYALYSAFNNLINDSNVIDLPKDLKSKFESPLFKYFVLYLTVFVFTRNAIITLLIVIGIALFVQYLRSPLERKQHPYLL